MSETLLQRVGVALSHVSLPDWCSWVFRALNQEDQRIRELEAQLKEAKDDAKRWYADFDRLRTKAPHIRDAALEAAAEHFEQSIPPNRFNWTPQELGAALRALKGGES